jgi:hypothetical protein
MVSRPFRFMKRRCTIGLKGTHYKCGGSMWFGLYRLRDLRCDPSAAAKSVSLGLGSLPSLSVMSMKPVIE